MMVDGQGNFGSVDGDPPAAMRYTESRLTRIAGEMLADIDMDTVDFVPNYDESTLRALRPPRARSPTSSSTAAPASPSAWPPTSRRTTSPKSSTPPSPSSPRAPHDTTSDLALCLEHVLGPDFPTGGVIFGRTQIPNAYRTGRGRFIVRSRTKIEKISGGREAIIVTEIPYQVNKTKLMERIAELVNEGIITDIARDEFRDESDRDGMRIHIGLKRGAEHQIVLNQLHKHTQMQEILLHDLPRRPQRPAQGAPARPRHPRLPRSPPGRRPPPHRLPPRQSPRPRAHPPRLPDRPRHPRSGHPHHPPVHLPCRRPRKPLRLLLRPHHLPPRHRARRHHPRPRKVRHRPQHPARARRHRRHRRHPHPLLRQIDAILELQLYRLTQLSIDELLRELAQIRENIAEYESHPQLPRRLREVIVQELTDIRDRYGDERRTLILDDSADLQLEDLIADEQVAVTVSHTGYLKRTPISTYRQQRRGGTGRIGMKTRDEDFVAQLIIESTHTYLLCFTNTGRVYWLKIYEIPDTGITGKGKAMASLVDLQPGEKVVTILPVRNLTEDGQNILFATRNGTVKKTPLKDFSNVMARGIIAINIDKDDELITARVTDGTQVIFLATHDGMAIRFNEQDLRAMGRPATGNRGINLRKGDYVIGAAVTPPPKPAKNSAANAAEALGLTQQLEAVIGHESGCLPDSGPRRVLPGQLRR